MGPCTMEILEAEPGILPAVPPRLGTAPPVTEGGGSSAAAHRFTPTLGWPWGASGCAESQRQLSHPRGTVPCAVTRTCSPGSATGAPAAPKNGSTHPSRLGGTGQALLEIQGTPSPPAGTEPDFSCPEGQLLHTFPSANGTSQSPAGREHQVGRAEPSAPPSQLHLHPKHPQNPIIN